MAAPSNSTPASRFHNVSDEALADKIGRVDANLKAVDAECKVLKDEFKRRQLTRVAGDSFTVTASDQVSWRLDAKAVREHLGALASRFETIGTATVIRIVAANRRAIAA